MAFFGRNEQKRSPEQPQGTDDSPTGATPRGPQDSAGKSVPAGYLDFGALYVPSIPGMQIQAQFESDKVTTRSLLLVIGSSGIQVRVVAAPRSGGVWPEMRKLIASSISKSGGSVDTIEDHYGTELVAKIGIQMPDGSRRSTPRIIIGVEGPRWLARIDLQGAAAAGDTDQLIKCYEIIDKLIVNRGPEPRIRFELLPLRLPEGSGPQDGLV